LPQPKSKENLTSKPFNFKAKASEEFPEWEVSPEVEAEEELLGKEVAKVTEGTNKAKELAKSRELLLVVAWRLLLKQLP
tara:strand:- start:527 stop:763 length:237 start_codon:yes stop_codon:yes gene_type:complete